MNKHKDEVWAIILAAGSGQRIQTESKGLAKQYLEYQHKPLYLHSAITFTKLARLSGLIFVFPEQDLASQKQYLLEQSGLNIPYKIVAGGKLRQDSARLGLEALPKSCNLVFIHDAARPFFTVQLIQKMLKELEDGLEQSIAAIIPAVQVTDTIKEASEQLVIRSLERSKLVAVQTPQLFISKTILEAHKKNQEIVTDDATLLEQSGLKVKICEGELSNSKITYPKDLSMLQTQEYEYRTTYGEDIHKFTDPENIKARIMKLGGIEIAKAPYIEAHSDGDVLLHALADAILAAANSLDIGQIFSDQDPANENLSSAVILDEALSRLQKKEGSLSFIDLTIVSEKPKIAPEHSKIINNIARLLGVSPDKISLKAKTSESLGFIGQGLAIKAIAIVNSKFITK